MTRKNPILLRRGPMSGRINALTNYRYLNGGRTLKVVGDGKHDVSSDFDSLLLDELLPGESCPLVTAALDGAADGEELNVRERAELRALRDRLVSVIDRHNAALGKERPTDG